MPYDPPARNAAIPPETATRWPGWLLHLALFAVAATLAGLAALWLIRNPLLASYDEVGHANATLWDALLLREGRLAALRDDIFLRHRSSPPGLRLFGLPIAAAFWNEASTALRISAAVLTLLPALVIYLGLRRMAGHAGAAAGALFFLLTPQNLVGAQSFMTELVLDLAAALAMALLLQEILGSRPSLSRLLLLGP